MHSFIDHARDFAYGQERERFGTLTEGQSPKTLSLTCPDARVPSRCTGPGRLAEPRTAGDAVPEYSGAGTTSGDAAIDEYAVTVLQVPGIAVRGHSRRDAVGARAHREHVAAVPAVTGRRKPQLPHLRPGAPAAGADDDPQVAGAVQRHAEAQPDRLRRYPRGSHRPAAGRLRPHGWYCATDTGAVMEHDPSADAFLPL